jgi:signal transduction histidine kinase
MTPRSDFARQQRIAFWILGIGLLMLLLANALGWIYLQRIKTFFVSDLKFRLENIVNIASKLIDANDISYIVPGDQSDPQVLFYQSLLYEIKENNNLMDIYIVSPALENLIEISPDVSRISARHSLERNLIENALNGQTTTSALQTLGEHKFLTTITPLFDANNMIAGLLVVEATAEFFDILDQFDRSLIIFSLMNFILIISIAFILFRSIKRVFHLQNLIKNQEHLVNLGEMAASVAHELRNPFGIIKGANSLIQKKYGDKKDEVFTYIPAELDRLNKLIEDFLTFARSRVIKKEDVNLHQLLSRIKLGFAEYKDITIQLDVADNFPIIKTDADVLEQVFLNIIKNSIQVLKEGGQISIKCEKPDKKVLIQVTDNGSGVSEEIIDRIFEPFFTTKQEGSGLGLAISKRLIEQLDGEIFIKSVPGSGTIVKVRLPV